jgi:hypothetical protein
MDGKEGLDIEINIPTVRETHPHKISMISCKPTNAQRLQRLTILSFTHAHADHKPEPQH